MIFHLLKSLKKITIAPARSNCFFEIKQKRRLITCRADGAKAILAFDLQAPRLEKFLERLHRRRLPVKTGHPF